MSKHTGATLRSAGALLCALVSASCDTTAPSGTSAWSLERVSGDGQVMEVGAQVGPPVVRVLVKGRPLANIAVQWSADADGSADGVTRTDARGLARGMWWLGPLPGKQHLTATLGSSLAQPVTFSATALAGQMARLLVRPKTGVLPSVRDSLQLIAIATDRFGNTVPASGAQWVSLDPLFATVSSSGMVLGRNGGTARIVLTSPPFADTSSVTVSQPATSVRLEPDTVFMAALTRVAQLRVVARDGFGNTILAPAVAWSSFTPGVATVDANGQVTAVANGTATIFGRVGGVGGSATVVVQQVSSHLTVTPLFPTLLLGDSVRIAAVAYDAANKVMPSASWAWSSSDTTVAVVAADGWVRSVRVGQAIIHIVASPGGAWGQSVVTVNPTP